MERKLASVCIDNGIAAASAKHGVGRAPAPTTLVRRLKEFKIRAHCAIIALHVPAGYSSQLLGPDPFTERHPRWSFRGAVLAKRGGKDMDIMASDDSCNSWRDSSLSPSNSTFKGSLLPATFWRFPRIDSAELVLHRSIPARFLSISQRDVAVVVG